VDTISIGLIIAAAVALGLAVWDYAVSGWQDFW
jgi:hypothetical protein